MEVYSSKDKRPCCTNTIVEIIENIARTQRNVCNTCEECVGCDVCFSRFNTIPIRLTTCCGNVVGGVIGAGGITTNYFRVECINHQRFVKLRLLTITTVDEEIVVEGTNYTMVVDLECIGNIQCFEAVNVLGCTTVV